MHESESNRCKLRHKNTAAKFNLKNVILLFSDLHVFCQSLAGTL